MIKTLPLRIRLVIIEGVPDAAGPTIIVSAHTHLLVDLSQIVVVWSLLGTRHITIIAEVHLSIRLVSSTVGAVNSETQSASRLIWTSRLHRLLLLMHPHLRHTGSVERWFKLDIVATISHFELLNKKVRFNAFYLQLWDSLEVHPTSLQPWSCLLSCSGKIRLILYSFDVSTVHHDLYSGYCRFPRYYTYLFKISVHLGLLIHEICSLVSLHKCSVFHLLWVDLGITLC